MSGTTEDLDRLRRLDQALAERVFGWTRATAAEWTYWLTPDGEREIDLPRWSATWGEAREVVEAMRERWRSEGSGWTWNFCDWEDCWAAAIVDEFTHTMFEESAKALPEAISVAALLASGVPAQDIP